MEKDAKFSSNSVQNIIIHTKKIDKFLARDGNFIGKLKTHLKNSYDVTRNSETKSSKQKALPELYLKGFDIEQVWQQADLQNDSIFDKNLACIAKNVKGNLLFDEADNVIKSVDSGDRLVGTNNDDPEENVDDENESDDDDDHDDEREEKEVGDEVEGSGSVSEDDRDLNEEDFNLAEEGSGGSGNESEERNVEPPQDKKNGRGSKVEDQFFKLDEMEKFLVDQEKKVNDPDSGNDSEGSGSESEDSVDLFEAHSDEEDEVDARMARYKDFFVAKEESKKKDKRNKFFEEREQEGNSEEEPTVEELQKSTYEMRQERLKRRIEEIEEDTVREKEWQLRGEVTADKRPQNSLLEDILDFDLTTRPAPVITEETTFRLEDIIRQRIKDKVFDSVERKFKPIDTPMEYRKKLILDHEKSKESLAQIYEREYLEQKEALNPDSAEKEEEVPPLHREIDAMMGSLFNKLDALSNFHFTPKPSVPELRIVANVPAIQMEEVAPVAASDAALLAPEEVKRKSKGDVVGKDERTDTDKKRERRKKKKKQRAHVIERLKREAMSSKKLGLGNKYTKEKAKKMLDKVTKERNVDKMDESLGNKSVKSSKAFFTQLEEEVKSQIKNRIAGKKHKKSDNNVSAKKFKL